MYYPLIVNFSPIYYFMYDNFNKYINNIKISRNYCSVIHIISCLFLLTRGLYLISRFLYLITRGLYLITRGLYLITRGLY